MRLTKASFIKGAVFHIFNHSIPELSLFREKEDYYNCLYRFKTKVKIYPAKVFAYCLMPNHFHFLMMQDSKKPIYRIFNDVFAGYVQYYNKKYGRKGSLFQNSLQHKLIDNTSYLVNICRYIHQNPLKAKLVKDLEDWEFSNYPEWIGQRDGSLFDDAILKEHFTGADEYKDSLDEVDAEKIEKYLFNQQNLS